MTPILSESGATQSAASFEFFPNYLFILTTHAINRYRLSIQSLRQEIVKERHDTSRFRALLCLHFKKKC